MIHLPFDCITGAVATSEAAKATKAILRKAFLQVYRFGLYWYMRSVLKSGDFDRGESELRGR